MKAIRSLAARTAAAWLALITAAIPTAAADAPGTSQEEGPNAICPFHVHGREAALMHLRQRLAAKRWPDKETVNDESQGIRLAEMQALVSYWATDCDWRKREAKLNALPEIVTTIDGVDIQFIWIRSKDPDAPPMILTHGWRELRIASRMIRQLMINRG